MESTGLGKSNTAELGGAVYMTGGTLDVNGSITGNKATSDGGGIYQSGGTIKVYNGGGLYLNNAVDGGGIYTVGGALTVDGNIGDKTTIPDKVLGNSASGNGGGIYSNGGTVNITGNAEVKANSAATGGGIYVSSATNVPLPGYVPRMPFIAFQTHMPIN